ARGEQAAAAAGRVTAQVPGARVSHGADGDLVCVTATLDVAVGGLISLPVSASSCALDGGL
ncbi:MAG: hypothetical protein QM630_06940, partial [Microbacterium sp.]